MEIMKDIKKKLVDLDRNGVWLANEMGITISRLSGYLNGYRQMPSRLKVKMIKILVEEESNKNGKGV